MPGSAFRLLSPRTPTSAGCADRGEALLRHQLLGQQVTQRPGSSIETKSGDCVAERTAVHSW